MNQQLKALISARAKKFIASQLCVANWHNKLQGVFPIMIGFVSLGHLFCMIPYKQKVAKDDKANHG